MTEDRGTTAASLGARQHTLLADEYANMLSCIRCGLCLTSCPTYVLSGHEAEGPRGRIAMMRGLVEGTLHVTPDLITHEQNCLMCDACSAVCPAGVHMDRLQAAVRTVIEPTVKRPLWQRALRQIVFRRIFADMRRFRLLVRVLSLYQRLGLRWIARRSGLLRLLQLAEIDALMPPLQSGGFVVPHGEVYAAKGETGAAPDAERHVALFAGCVMSTALAGIDRATIRILQRAGWVVCNPVGQGCCGALHAHSGDAEGAMILAKRNIQAFERVGGQLIAVNAAGCGAMLKDYARHLRNDLSWSTRASAFSARVKDVTEILLPSDLPFRRPWAGSVTYQEPCHLVHAQRICKQPRTLLQAIPGLELREMAESSLCCGSAGIYNITTPRISRELRTRKLDHAAKTGATTIVTANPGCYLQLQRGLAESGSSVRVQHIVEVLDEATTPVLCGESGGNHADVSPRA
jgi:glycolate oxidase iron-sulfur subunit